MNSKEVINVFQLLHENCVEVKEYYKAEHYTTPPMRAITGVRFPDKTICKYGEWAIQFNDESFFIINNEDFQRLFTHSAKQIWDAARSIVPGHGCNNDSFKYESLKDYLSTTHVKK